MPDPKHKNEAEIILSALEADHCVDESSAMTSERLIELCDYSYLFDEDAIEEALITLVQEAVITAAVDSNDEPVFWLTHPVLH